MDQKMVKSLTRHLAVLGAGMRVREMTEQIKSLCSIFDLPLPQFGPAAKPKRKVRRKTKPNRKTGKAKKGNQVTPKARGDIYRMLGRLQKDSPAGKKRLARLMKKYGLTSQQIRMSLYRTLKLAAED